MYLGPERKTHMHPMVGQWSLWSFVSGGLLKSSIYFIWVLDPPHCNNLTRLYVHLQKPCGYPLCHFHLITVRSYFCTVMTILRSSVKLKAKILLPLTEEVVGACPRKHWWQDWSVKTPLGITVTCLYGGFLGTEFSRDIKLTFIASVATSSSVVLWPHWQVQGSHRRAGQPWTLVSMWLKPLDLSWCVLLFRIPAFSHILFIICSARRNETQKLTIWI